MRIYKRESLGILEAVLSHNVEVAANLIVVIDVDHLREVHVSNTDQLRSEVVVASLGA